MNPRVAGSAPCGMARHLLARRLAGMACWAGMAVAAHAVASDPPVRLEIAAAPAVSGGLRSIEADVVELVVDGETRRVPLADVRMLTVVEAAAGGAATALASGSSAIDVVGDAGLAINADDLRWEGGTATLARGDDAIELPIERVRRVAWRPSADAAGADWLEAVPAEPVADLVAVSRPEGFELVECAITAVSTTAVTVVLDGERIPVGRRKVLGLVWARPAPATRAATRLTPVTIEAGRLGAATVAWRDGWLVLDGEVRIPGRLLRSIDFAAGRTVALAAIEPETTSSDPFFGGLATIDGLGAFVAPRVVTPKDGRPAWLMRPRASATWRVPERSRRFRAEAVVAAASTRTDVVVWARADEGREWRQTVAGDAAVAIELDVHDARRLTIGVDFGGDGGGVPVRFDHAGFEK